MSNFFAAFFAISMAACAMVVAVGLAVGVWVLIFTAIDNRYTQQEDNIVRKVSTFSQRRVQKT
jgi:hypothetical protein